MITRFFDECNKSYDFKPMAQWPSQLPLFSWGPELLCGFTENSSSYDNKVIDLKSQNKELFQVFSSLYPSLTFAELARFYSLLTNSQEVCDWSAFFAKYQLRWSENLKNSMMALVKTPLSFQNWTSQKLIQARELSGLRCINNFEEFNSYLECLAQLNPSRSIGIQILENLVELFEMKTSKNVLLPMLQLENEKLILDKLLELRYPNSTQHLKNQQNQCQQSFKVNGVEGAWKRYGDKSGLEVKFFSENSSDFQKRMQSLNKWFTENKDSTWI